jgi:hypothetical protein
MSAWRIGSDRKDIPTFMGTDLQTYLDRVTKWIPGDVLAIYAAGVTVLANREGAQPNIHWLAVMALATPAIVLLGGWATGALRREHAVRAALAIIAFGIWSVTVPFSGWQQWDVIARDSGFVAVLAGLSGIIFGLFADGAVLRWVKS